MRAFFTLNVSDFARHRNFWIDTLGGTAEAADVFAFPKARFVLTLLKPSGGTRGTAVNHVAFGVPDIRAAVDRTKKAGFAMVTRAELPDRFDVVDDLGFIPQLDTSVAFTIGPDDIKVEFLEVKGAVHPMAFHHVHFFCPEPEKMKMWYADVFGVPHADRGPFPAIDLPGGLNLTFSPSAAVVPTRGRVLDRIGFELSDGAAFSGNVLVDPWGTTIEISEPR